MKNNVRQIMWLYANGCIETVDIISPETKNIMDQFVALNFNKCSVWTRIKKNMDMMDNENT